MDKYLVTYEYKVREGSFIYTKTKTRILTLDEINKLTLEHDYMKVLFCQKL